MKKLVFIMMFFVGVLWSNNTHAQSNSDWSDFMDSWCESYFSDCFSGRKYIKIKVYETKTLDDCVKLSGNVTYKGYLGITYTTEFNAKVYPTASAFKVVFNKESKSATGGSYWEDCTKTKYK